MIRFGFGVVASSLHPHEAVERIVAPVASRLAELGGERVADPTAYPDVPYLLVVATGGTEAAALDVLRRRAAAVPWEPVVLVAHPWHNSLPASLETLARVSAEGGRGRIVQVGDELGGVTASDASTGERQPDPLETLLVDLAAMHRLRRARLGLVGAPSEWLVASVPDAAAVRRRWGIELVEVDIADTIAGQRRADPVATRAVAVKFSRRRPGSDHAAASEPATVAGGEPAAPAGETVAAAALHPALVATIERARVDAVTVRCFDFLGELTTSGCVALAELNDTGTVAGCEGDVAAAVAMMIARELLGTASWVANPATIDPDGGRMLLAHCTVAPSLVEDVDLHTHFESGIGIGLRGTFRPGPVTLLRLGGRGLEDHWFADADIVGTGDSADLCRTQVSLRLEPAALHTLLEAPLGNHLVLVPGHHRARLERWWRLVQG